jgi:voltage-gated sodium channel
VAVLAGGGGFVPMLRLLRLFRVLKLLKTVPQLMIIVNALINGFRSIGFIGVILFLFFYIFGIIGEEEFCLI